MGANDEVGAVRLEDFRAYLNLLANVLTPPALVRGPIEVVDATLADAARDLDRLHELSAAELADTLRRMLLCQLHNRLPAESAAGTVADRDRSPAAHLDRAGARVSQWLAAPELSAAAQAEREAQLRRLAGALAQLPDDQRAAIELKQLQGWSMAAISEHLHCSEIAVAGLLRRGLQRLAQVLVEVN